MKYKNILVTGAAGFIGFNFVRKVSKSSDVRITVVDKLTYAHNPSAIRFFKDKNIKLIKKDINDVSQKYVSDEGFDLIINFAAESHVDNSIKNPKIFIETNVNGTFNLLNIAKNLKIRYHQVSTDEVYGDLPINMPNLKFTTNSNINPSSPYSASKSMADLLVVSYVRTFGVEATISRCSNNYGPYQNIEKLIPKTISSIMNGKKIGIYGDGGNIRDWIHVDDHNDALLVILDTREKGIFNIGSNNEISNLNIVKIISKCLNVPFESTFGFIKDRPGHDVRYAIDPESMTKIGWSPKIDFEDGIKSTIEFYKNNN